MNAVGGDGSPAALFADDPPHHLWQGVMLWRDVSSRVREAYRKQDAVEDGARAG